MKIIGISGKKHSGKDAVADAIKDFYAFANVEKIAFALALKEEVCKACGITMEYLEANKKHFRLILQGWGTDFKRHLVSDKYWLAKWLEKSYESSADIVVVPDVRFLNEAALIKEIGGQIWRVDRREYDHDIEVTRTHDDTHASECELDNYNQFDQIIRNYSTLERLKKAVQDTLRMIKL